MCIFSELVAVKVTVLLYIQACSNPRVLGRGLSATGSETVRGLKPRPLNAFNTLSVNL